MEERIYTIKDSSLPPGRKQHSEQEVSALGSQTHKPPKKLQDIHYRFIDDTKAENDELQALKLHLMFALVFPDLRLVKVR